MAPPELALELAPGLEAEFVHVPAGKFVMGSEEDDPHGAIGETPQSEMYLEEYWIGRYPVSNLQYWAFDPDHTYADLGRQDVERLPVRGFYGIEKAIEFCDWASAKTGRTIRLPNEPEWEKAARGADGRIWPWGNNPPDDSLCNFSGSGLRHSTPVGRFSPQGDSPYGCADMAGNVFELTRSLRGTYPYDKDDGREAIIPGDAVEYIIRGGYHSFAANMIRCAVRWNGVQSETGLRLVMEP